MRSGKNSNIDCYLNLSRFNCHISITFPICTIYPCYISVPNFSCSEIYVFSIGPKKAPNFIILSHSPFSHKKNSSHVCLVVHILKSILIPGILSDMKFRYTIDYLNWNTFINNLILIVDNFCMGK